MKKCFLTLLLTILSIIAFNIYLKDDLNVPAEFETVSPKITNIATSIKSKGRFVADSQKTVYLPYGYKIGDLFINEGDRVKKNENLLSFEKMHVTPTFDPYALAKNLKETTGGFDYSDVLSVFQSNNLALPENMELSVDGEVGSLKTDVETGNVESPITGIVTRLSVREGDEVNPAQGIVTVTDADHMMIKTNISENLISSIEEGQPVIISGDSLGGKQMTGRVRAISPVAKQKISLTYPETVVEVTVAPNSETTNLKPGYSVELSIITATKNDILTIPYEALTQDEDNREVVYVIENGRVRKRYVATGLEAEDSVEIIFGLDEYDEVILNPPDHLKNMQKVKQREEDE
jgi:multidrug efflux pump subunit AcrA (membrane-fusion protein)